jgi:nucleotide-binding universal stress UspA family protein
MFTKILIPLDGSTFAGAALPLGLALSCRTKAALHLVTVVEPIPMFAYDQWEVSLREGAEGYLASTAERVRALAGAEVTTALRSGHVVETLLTEAGACEADLIVMATHGRGALSRAWLGSVADGVTRHAAIPVMLVRPTEDAAETDEPTRRIGTILVPLDGTKLSEQALEHAVELGELFGSGYHLTRVVPFPLDVSMSYMPMIEMYQTTLAEAKAAAAEYVEAQAQRMRRHGARVTTSVVTDAQAGHGILSEADAVGSDLIVMATHSRTGFGRFVLGSTADKVLRGAQVPLLLHRAATSASPDGRAREEGRR